MRISDWSSDVCSSDLPHHEYWERHSKGEIKEIIRFDRNSPLFSREALTEVDLLAIPKERFPEYETRLAYAKALKNAPRGRRSGTKAQAIIDDTARALGDENPPKLRTVQGYVRVLRASGGDAKFLISLHTVKIGREHA